MGRGAHRLRARAACSRDRERYGRGSSAPYADSAPRSRAAGELPAARRHPRRRFSLGADRAVGRRRTHPRGHHSGAARGGRISGRDGAVDADPRQPIGIGDPERAPLPRDRGQERATGARQPAQIAVPRQYEPRAAHAAKCDPRLCRIARRRHLWRVAGPPQGRSGAHSEQRQAPAGIDQRRARLGEDRGRPADPDT